MSITKIMGVCPLLVTLKPKVINFLKQLKAYWTIPGLSTSSLYFLPLYCGLFPSFLCFPLFLEKYSNIQMALDRYGCLSTHLFILLSSAICSTPNYGDTHINGSGWSMSVYSEVWSPCHSCLAHVWASVPSFETPINFLIFLF